MVKGISRRVVVVDSPDQRFFEQAIFIVRNDAGGEGVTAGNWWRSPPGSPGYTAGSRLSRAWRELNPLVYTLIGAGSIGLVWLIVTLI